MMKDKFKAFWIKLSSKQRRSFVMVTVGCALIGFSLMGYLATRGKTAPPEDKRKQMDLALEPKLLEKTQYLETQKEMARKDEENRLLKQQMEAIKNGTAGAGTQPASVASATTTQGQPPVPGQPIPVAQGNGPQPVTGNAAAGRKGAKGSVAFASPPPPSLSKGTLPLPPPPPMPSGEQYGQPATPPESEVGDISLVSSSSQAKIPPAEDKKKETTAMYLPPSFMEAILLSGLDAPTSSDAKGNPVPALMKVKTPAFLPNSVRADLKGCYVIADGRGNLATERAELLLVSLSCLDRKGRAVIDQKVKGFVVDQDSKIGLRGRVVAKMGSMIVRSMIA